MLYSILVSLFQAAIVVAATVGIVYLFIKKPMVFICTVAVALVLTGLIIAPSVAEETTIETKGTIVCVAPKLFDSYPCIVVTVKTFDGEVYTYYSEEGINVQSIITIVLFGDEVIDAY